MSSGKRPLPARITVALVLVLIAVGWNILRLAASISLAPIVRAYAPSPGPAYIGTTGALFATAGLVLLWAFWRRRPWAPPALLLGSLAYMAWYWADYLLFQQAATSAWRCSLVITLLALTYVALVARDHRNSYYFGREAHEREEQDRSTA